MSTAAPRRREVRDIPFTADPTNPRQRLDLHLPAADSPPVIVFIHGGGWLRGDRRTVAPGLVMDVFAQVLDAGFAVASIDYRLSDEAVFPAQIDDALAAVRWVLEYGTEYGIDADRPVLWGESAGAHLAALAAFRLSDRIRGVIDWFGPSNLITFPYELDPENGSQLASDTESREARLLGGSIDKNQTLARRASPVFQVTPAAPPFHIAHGTADTLVPFAQSAELAAALTAVRVDVELIPVVGADHMWRGVEDPQYLVEAALQFAGRVTGASGGVSDSSS